MMRIRSSLGSQNTTRTNLRSRRCPMMISRRSPRDCHSSVNILASGSWNMAMAFSKLTPCFLNGPWPYPTRRTRSLLAFVSRFTVPSVVEPGRRWGFFVTPCYCPTALLNSDPVVCCLLDMKTIPPFPPLLWRRHRPRKRRIHGSLRIHGLRCTTAARTA